MKLIDKKEFLEESGKALGEIYDMVANLSSVKLTDFSSENTALVFMDMVNGFAKEGALFSPRIADLIPEAARLSKACDELNITKLALSDTHGKKSPEFEAYPPHCIEGSAESDVVDELKAGEYTLIPKNSTNGFLEKRFKNWLKNHENIDTFIVVGDCTDICIQQFTITLKTWFNMQNQKTRVIVPINAVDTFDLGMHNANLMNIAALYFMTAAGVELVAEVK